MQIGEDEQAHGRRQAAGPPVVDRGDQVVDRLAAAGGDAGPQAANQSQAGQKPADDSTVVDADFEEVDENKKNKQA